jgi:HSP20 family protein
MDDRNSKPDAADQESEKPLDTQFTGISVFDNWQLSIRSPSWRPPTDVYEVEGDLIVRVEIAGMREEDFSIELNGRVLSIHGIRQDLTGRRAYHQMEIRFGEFNIELELPFTVDEEQVRAVYDKGFLRVQLPKAHPRQVIITG